MNFFGWLPSPQRHRNLDTPSEEAQRSKYELEPRVAGPPQRITFFDLETLRLANECGGWSNIEQFGLAVGVTWTEAEGFREWFEPDARSLVGYLLQHDRVVGFNVLEFDYRVLSAYEPSAPQLLRTRTVDMLSDIHHQLSFRISLNDLASATLGKGKTGKGEEAVRWWREGKRLRVIQYCRDDVTLTKELYGYGSQKGSVYYLDRSNRKMSIPVSWEL